MFLRGFQFNVTLIVTLVMDLPFLSQCSSVLNFKFLYNAEMEARKH